MVQGFLFHGSHLNYEVYHAIALAILVVIHRNQLDYVVLEGNSSPSIKDKRVSVTVKVSGDNLNLSLTEYAP